MELIVIDENKLKIMLSAPDMQHYELRAERMDCADEETRRAFRHIFHDARDRIGFDTEGERLFVQLYTSRGGGCEIFVTKLGERNDLMEAVAVPPAIDDSATTAGENALLEKLFDSGGPAKETAMTRPVSTPPPIERQEVAYACTGSAALLSLCRRLATIGYRGQSETYIDIASTDNPDDIRWYLFLELPPHPCIGTGKNALPRELAFLGEYGDPVPDIKSTRTYLSEYGRSICASDAVHILGRL